MKLPLLLLMFSLFSSFIFGADLYLTSADGLPMEGFEFQDLTVSWQSAKELKPVAVGQGYPVAQYRDSSFSSGWAYDFSKNRREIRAAYRKANKVTSKGRHTIVLVSEDWCGPCKTFKAGEVWRWVAKEALADSEVSEMDAFPSVKSIPTVLVVDADNGIVRSIPASEATVDYLKGVLK